MPDMAWKFLRGFSQRSIAKKADLTVLGLENVPSRGPVILAVRHVHHQIDGEALLATIPRPIHPMVATDWAAGGFAKRLLTFACRQARWPTVIRGNSPFSTDQGERGRLNIRAFRDALQLLREDRIVAIFPEGFPNIDKHPTPKQGDDDMLPFEPGFARLAQMAARQGVHAPIIPVGFRYERGDRWHVTMRFGSAIEHRGRTTAELIAETEHAVSALSTPRPA
jgi:putative membrane protein